MNSLPLIVTVSALVLTAVPALAQQTSCVGAPYDAFDFWLGTWDVTTPDGKKAGVNRIEKAEQNCLVIERWASVAGGTGQSYNFYDPGIDQWRQIWISAGFVIDYAGGLNDAGDMILEGEIRYRSGDVAPFRGRRTPLSDGTVEQHFDQYNTEKESWSPWFTGLYTRQLPPAPARTQ